MKHLLVVDDSTDFQALLYRVLSPYYHVTPVTSAREAIRLVTSPEKYDLVVLDLGLPDMDGMQVLEEMRKHRNQTPLIILTGRDSVKDKVTGLRAGAEDYLIKPFEPEELLARIAIRIQRHSSAGAETHTIQLGPFSLDLALQKAIVAFGQNSEELLLTPIEFRVLAFFLTEPEKTVSRDRLVEATIGSGIHVLSRTIDKHICSLRRKIGTYGDSIVTVFGKGYRFIPPPALPVTKSS